MASRGSAVLAIALLMAILLVSGTDAMICSARSKLYRGRCNSNRNCMMVCLHEGFTGGYCKNAIWPKCMCTKLCDPTNARVRYSPPA